ncbi:MAG: DUF1127 domain-containing protein [Magnetovibrionaceae bacterium]
MANTLNLTRNNLYPLTLERKTAAQLNAELTQEVKAGVRGLFARMLQSWRRDRAYQQTLRELSALDDAQLDDIGMVRGEIPLVAARVAETAFPKV